MQLLPFYNILHHTDYFTDASEGDFTEIQPTAATEVLISGGPTADTVSGPITVTITNDEDCESTESFNVYLTDIEGGQLDSTCTAAVQITDDEGILRCLLPFRLHYPCQEHNYLVSRMHVNKSSWDITQKCSINLTVGLNFNVRSRVLRHEVYTIL